jgi:hypothetical protein
METKQKYPIVKFKWWYCLILGLANIIDGLTMMLTLGWFATGLALKFSLFGASKKIYRK